MTLRPIVSIAACIAILEGCAGRAEVQSLRQQVENIDHAVAPLSLAQWTNPDPNRLQSDLKSVDAERRVLAAKVAGLEGQLSELDHRVDAVQREVTTTAAAVATLKESVDKHAAAPAALPGPVVGAPGEEGAAGRSAQAERDYAAALRDFHAREHGEAVLEFMDFLTHYPEHPLAANAQYWIGEAYYEERDFRHAATEFGKVLDHGARNPKAADALLMVGLCRRSVHDRAGATVAWRRVVHDYPNSDAAARARALLHSPGRL